MTAAFSVKEESEFEPVVDEPGEGDWSKVYNGGGFTDIFTGWTGESEVCVTYVLRHDGTATVSVTYTTTDGTLDSDQIETDYDELIPAINGLIELVLAE